LPFFLSRLDLSPERTDGGNGLVGLSNVTSKETTRAHVFPQSRPASLQNIFRENGPFAQQLSCDRWSIATTNDAGDPGGVYRAGR